MSLKGTRARSTGSFPWRLAAASMLMLALSACGGGGAPMSPALPVFTPLGVLAGHTASQANGISADGSTVVGTSTDAQGRTLAVRWTAASQLTSLGLMPGGTRSAANAVSADGSVIVGTGDVSAQPVSSSSSAFRWTAGTGLVRLDPLPGPGQCTASGVSGDGSVVVGGCLVTTTEGYRWTQQTGPVGLGFFGGGTGATSNAYAVSRDGTVTVGAGNTLLAGAMYWTSSGAVVLGKLPGDSTAVASGVSANGSVIVGTSAAATTSGFIWTAAGGMVRLAPVADGILQTSASAVSGDGATVVGSGITAAGETATLWTAARGVRTIEFALANDYGMTLAGWKLTRATAVSDDGRSITGYGVSPAGRSEGWLLQRPR